MRIASNLLSIVLIVLTVSFGCSGPAKTASRPSVATPPGPTIAGTWAWLHDGTIDDIRSTETETWTLTVDGGKVSGHYDRLVVFESSTGVPFDCNQHIRYGLRTRYAVEGTVVDGEITLSETSYEVTPSPCEQSHRKLKSYKALLSPDGDTLALLWTDGKQNLRRVPEGTVIEGAGPAVPESSTTGRWTWQTINLMADGTKRLEIESWYLIEQDGEIRGDYRRELTVSGEDGETIECAGEASYRYTDRFKVRGSRKADTLHIVELSAEHADHPCAAPNRSFDEATGALYGDYIVLTWRGRRRQVLRRPLDRASATETAGAALRLAP